MYVLTFRPDYTVELKGQTFVYSLASIPILPGVKFLFPISDGFLVCVVAILAETLENNVCFSVMIQNLMAGPESNGKNTVHILLLVSLV